MYMYLILMQFFSSNQKINNKKEEVEKNTPKYQRYSFSNTLA